MIPPIFEKLSNLMKWFPIVGIFAAIVETVHFWENEVRNATFKYLFAEEQDQFMKHFMKPGRILNQVIFKA